MCLFVRKMVHNAFLVYETLKRAFLHINTIRNTKEQTTWCTSYAHAVFSLECGHSGSICLAQCAICVFGVSDAQTQFCVQKHDSFCIDTQNTVYALCI